MKKKHLIGFFLLSLILVLFIVPTRAYSKKLSPIDDAYVDNWYPDDNYGASDYLFIGTFLVGYCITFLKFQIPTTDRTVISATISTFWYNFLVETWLTVKVGTTSNTWTEETITYNNCPYFYNDLLTTKSITDGDNLNFDVTDFIPESGAFSIIIWEESDTGEWLQSDSKENEFIPDPPYLTITYESRIEDFLPAIIGGVVAGIVGIGVVMGVVLYLRNKKKLERVELDKKKLEKVESDPYKVNQAEYMFCPNCGRRLIKSALFCTNCGTPLQ